MRFKQSYSSIEHKAVEPYANRGLSNERPDDLVECDARVPPLVSPVADLDFAIWTVRERVHPVIHSREGLRRARS